MMSEIYSVDPNFCHHFYKSFSYFYFHNFFEMLYSIHLMVIAIHIVNIINVNIARQGGKSICQFDILIFYNRSGDFLLCLLVCNFYHDFYS